MLKQTVKDLLSEQVGILAYQELKYIQSKFVNREHYKRNFYGKIVNMNLNTTGDTKPNWYTVNANQIRCEK